MDKSEEISKSQKKGKNNDVKDDTIEIGCESCGKLVNKKSLLRHIGQCKKCKDSYGADFEKLTKEKKFQTWRQCSKDTYEKEKEKLLKTRRDRRQTKKQEDVSLAVKGLNINGKENQTEDANLKKSQMQCEFCRKIFHLSSALVHIANTEACKIFYGARLEELKKSHRMQRKRFYREEDGNEKELKQKRERYNSNPLVKQ